MNGLAPAQGGLRTHLDESSWALLAGAAGLPADAGLLSPLGPRPPSSGQPDPALLEATRLALTGPLRIEVSTAAGGRGVVAALGWDGVAGAVVVRALAAVDGRPAPAPGLEVSVFAPDRLVSELLRLLPPSRGHLTETDEEPWLVTAAPESGLMAVRAIRNDDADLLGEIAAAHGWDGVPDVLPALADDVRGQAVLVLKVAGSRSLQARSWLQTGTGWAAIGLTGGHVTHELQSLPQLGADLAYWLSGAASALREAAR